MEVVGAFVVGEDVVGLKVAVALDVGLEVVGAIVTVGAFVVGLVVVCTSSEGMDVDWMIVGGCVGSCVGLIVVGCNVVGLDDGD